MDLVKNVYAQVEKTVENPISGLFDQTATIGDIAGFVINIILGIGWALTFIMLAGGFIKYILSRGETKATDQARDWLTYAAIGGVGLFFITVIKNIIINLLNPSSIPGAAPGEEGQFDPFTPGGS